MGQFFLPHNTHNDQAYFGELLLFQLQMFI